MPPSNRKLLAFSSDYGYEEEVLSTDTVQLPKLVLTGVAGTGIDANNLAVINVPDPVNPQDAVNKRYADNLAQGIDAIDSCRALAASNIASLSGTTTVDGVALVAGDRVLLIGQSDPTQNGVWVVQANTWTRPNDFAPGLRSSGKHTFIESGDSVYASTGWVCNTQKGADVVGTNALSFVQFSGLGEVTAGSGLIKSSANGNTISVALANNPGLQFTNGALDHLLQATGALTKDSTGLGLLLKDATLGKDGSGLFVKGVPSLFTVGGNAVDANVTATALNTVSDGPGSQADAYHTHLSVLRAQALVDTHTNGSTALNGGDPVYWSSTGNTLARGDAAASSSANIIGLAAATAASGNASVWKHGIMKNASTGLTPGQQVFLAVGGGLTQTVPTTAGATIISLGVASSSTDIDVAVKFIGRRASA